MHAVLGKIVSGVVVPTTMKPIWSAVMPGLRHRPFGGDLREVRGGDAGLGDVALADPGALQDPLVGGVDQLLEVGVGQHARRHVGGEAGDLDGAELPALRDPADVVFYQSLSLCGAVRPKYS